MLESKLQVESSAHFFLAEIVQLYCVILLESTQNLKPAP